MKKVIKQFFHPVCIGTNPALCFDMNIFKKIGLVVVLTSVTFSHLKSETIQESARIGEKSVEILATEFFIKGNDASVHGDYKTAAKFFKDLVELQPQNNYFKSKLAIELIRSGELGEAEKILESLVNESHLKDESLRLILAGLYVALEKPDKARVIYNEILNTGTDIEEACIFFAKTFSTEKKYAEAHALLAKCEKKSKNEPIYAFYRGKIEFERGNKTEAEKFLKKSLKLNRTFDNAALVLGAIYEQKKDLKAAVKTYSDFLAADGNSNNIPVLSRLVALLFSMEENAAVIPYAEALNVINSTDINLKVRLGFLYSDSGRYEEAITIFKEALAITPDSEKINYYLGVVNQQANHLKEAIKFFERIHVGSELYKNAEKKIKQMTDNLPQENVPTALWALLLKELNTNIKQ